MHGYVFWRNIVRGGWFIFFNFFSIQPDTTIACSFLCSYITIIRQLMVVGHLYEVWATPPKSWLNARLIEGEWRIIDEEAWRKNRKIRKFVPIFPCFILSLHHFTLIMASCVCHQLLWLPAPCPFLRYFSGIPNPHVLWTVNTGKCVSACVRGTWDLGDLRGVWRLKTSRKVCNWRSGMLSSAVFSCYKLESLPNPIADERAALQPETLHSPVPCDLSLQLA